MILRSALVLLGLLGSAAGQVLRFDVAELDLSPESREVLSEALNANDWRQAEAVLFRETKRRPASAELLEALGVAHFQNGRHFQAAAAFKTADRLEPLGEDSRFALATTFVKMNRRHWARPELEKLAAEHPWNRLYPFVLAGIYYHFQWFGEALAETDRALAIDPKFALAHDRRGQCLEGMGRLEQALQAFRNAADLARDQKPASPWPAFHLGSLLHDLGELDEARAALLRATAADQDLAEAHYELGVVLWKQGALQPALESLTRAAQLNPRDAKPHYAQAQVYQRLGKREEAQQALRRFQQLR